jgi:rare lipoprotein A
VSGRRRLPRAILTGALLAAAALLAACAPHRAAPPAGPDQSRTVVDPPRSSRGNPPFYEVFGERYYVLDSSAGYSERGIASWYGRDFHGKPTSGGEIYDMHAMTAAHKTLPIPTWAEVTNLANGKRVIVRVNDRGPFVGGRIIDLSYRAATEIDMIRDGTARVHVRALGTPIDAGRPPVITTAAAPSPPRSGGFSIIGEARADTPGPDDRPVRQLFIQVGAFGEYGNAANLIARLKRSGFENSFIASSGAGREQIHRVQIGPLADAVEFDRVNQQLRSIGISDSRLVADN